MLTRSWVYARRVQAMVDMLARSMFCDFHEVTWPELASFSDVVRDAAKVTGDTAIHVVVHATVAAVIIVGSTATGHFSAHVRDGCAYIDYTTTDKNIVLDKFACALREFLQPKRVDMRVFPRGIVR